MRPIYDIPVKTGISNDVLNDYYDMATDENTISDEQLRRMLDSDDDVTIL